MNSDVILLKRILKAINDLENKVMELDKKVDALNAGPNPKPSQ
ncbi:MAG: hypothetical protein ABIF85_01570 [Nanoarchaeota archaeon]